MYPFCFDEFLEVIGGAALVNAKNKADFDHPLMEPIHQKLNEILRLFFLIGGMPEVVADYAEQRNLLRAQTILKDLGLNYQDDFKKYDMRISNIYIQEAFSSVIKQMGGKFMYSKVMESASHRRVKEALNLLIMAGLVFPVIHSSANDIPLGAEINTKNTKMLLLDTALFLQLTDMNLADILLEARKKRRKCGS